MAERVDIAVLGAGPAGAAAALGAAALGAAVVAIARSQERARPQRESLSPRTVEALRGLGCDAALAALEPPGERLVRWAGEERALPGEAFVERTALDAGLLADLARRGVRLLRDTVASALPADGGVRVALASGEALAARLAIEARGRSAPSSGARARGPETLFIVQRWRAPVSGRAESAVVSLAEGWAWLADDGRGGLVSQLACDAGAAPSRAGLGAHAAECLRADPWLAGRLREAAPQGEAFARAAGAVLDGAPAEGALLRVGDAALAVDPLSGNGVFQALSTALVAPAVANTVLHRPAQADLARRFHAERARDVFQRFARTASDFYARGAAHHGGAFWRARAEWRNPGTDAERAPGPALAIARRPVVCEGWIEERDVVLTPERPLGVWQLAGAELAPLVRASLRSAEDGARALGALPPAAREPVRAWLRARGLRA